MRFVIRLAFLLLASTASFAQLKESISVNIVEVPVTVVDSSGNPVRGLTAANFKLLDNGKERPISSFDTVDFGPTATAAAGPKLALAKMNPAARRNFMLLFDLSNSSPRALIRAQDSARQFVAKAVQPRDLVGVGTIDVEHGFRLLTAFTTDREMVATAISNPAAFKSNDPLQLSNETRLATLDTSLPSGTANGAAGDAKQERAAEVAADARESMARTQKINEQYVRGKVQRQVEYLGQLAKTLRAVAGRKQVVLLSEGFDPSVVTGRDARDGATASKEADTIMGGQAYLVDNDQRFGNTTSQSFVQTMAQFFRGSDVVLHAIDIQGVRIQNDIQSGARINSNAGLALLADPTGGTVFQNSNDMSGNFDRMLKAQEMVYILAFQAPTQKPGQFHNLSVKLVNVPGGARASSRAGYYEGGNETAAEKQLTTAEIILNDVPQNDLRVAALTAAFPGVNSANAQVPVILEIDGTDVLKDLKGNSASAEVYIYAFDADGMVRDRIYQKLNLDLKKVNDRLRASGIKYYGTLILPPGTYAVKSLVRIPETDRKGFVRTELTVPKQGQTAVLPPIFVDEAPKWLMVKGTSHAGEAPYPFDLSGEQFVPSALARVKSGESKRFAVFVLNAAPNEVTFDTTPKVKFLGAAKSGGASTALVMELDKPDPALATLAVTVKAKGATESQQIAIQ
jgi:VWFA-related protein